MGYQMPNVIKEIYLPINFGDNLTIEEYKAKYGIDLKKFIFLENNIIYIKFGLFKVYLVDLYNKEVFPFIMMSTKEYVEGMDNAETNLYGNPTGYASFGLKLINDSDLPFSIENVKIVYVEI